MTTDESSSDEQGGVLHRVTATADGRTATTDDGVLDVGLTTADGQAEGSTTPEHLMAAALAGCLQQALVIAAGTLAQDVRPTVAATVSLRGSSGGATGFVAAFELVVSGLDGEHADDLLAQAQGICPFTTALDGADLTVRRA